ncbi:TetR family transcriptional regulator [Micromonospora sonchi]|uniref:TetR family transcriptional regulator n=1 Tax=Micromonospora sonchi TaxID=1763543 RepID=A0A917U7B0_9ACTN|nr:TetR family transcriptional regulator [Micromonospora sonchi]GGM64214.1 TetR family transcriptional regulator [Micromonospora sonchi]
MTWVETDGTRSRILRAALDLFAVQGYQRTSLRQIAERLQLTKAAILYHFPSKGHLLTALAEPMVRDLETLVETACALSLEQARWTLLEGWVDTMLEHRGPLGMLFHDLALVERGSTYHRLVRIAMRANEIVAGPDADRRERVRAVQAIAMCSDPVVFLMDVPAPVLRVDMLDGVRRLLGGGQPGTARPPDTPDPTDVATGEQVSADAPTHARAAIPLSAPTGRRRPGRPPAMTSEQVRAARRMHAAGTHSADEIAAEFGVSRATVYRYLDSTQDTETVLR